MFSLEGYWLLEQTAQQDDEVTAQPFVEHRFSLGDLWVPMGKGDGVSHDEEQNPE